MTIPIEIIILGICFYSGLFLFFAVPIWVIGRHKAKLKKKALRMAALQMEAAKIAVAGSVAAAHSAAEATSAANRG